MEIETEYNVFGSFVKSQRESRGLSQDDLAKLLDLSRVSVANIEGGRQRVLLHQAFQLAKALDISLENIQSESTKRRIDHRIDQVSAEGNSKLSTALAEARRKA